MANQVIAYPDGSVKLKLDDYCIHTISYTEVALTKPQLLDIKVAVEIATTENRSVIRVIRNSSGI